MSSIELNKFIQKSAENLGFSKVGFAKAQTHLESQLKLSSWIDNGYHATMDWIPKRSTERGDILKYYPKAKSVISLGFNYFTGNTSNKKNSGKLSNYAWGDDYHNLIKSKLYQLLIDIKLYQDDINGIVCVDTSPIMEKDWAQKAGLGWIGKHTNLISRDFGSWIFLAEIILDIELEYDQPFIEDLCGTCTACLDNCPTNAFPKPYVLDANKCISYLTIEHRDSLPSEMIDKLSGWIYGCDICQEVCPWNIKFSQLSNEEGFQARSDLQSRQLSVWNSLTEEEFKILFKNSAVKRTKFKGLKRNITHNLPKN